MGKKKYRSQPNVPNLKPRMIIFLIGFVVCMVIGSILRGPVEPLNYVTDKNIFWILRDVRTICFDGLGQFLGRAVGLPVASAAGRTFTLISSAFFFLMSVSLYGAYSGAEIADFGEEPETGTSRTIHFIASYPYLASLAYIMMDRKFGGMGRSNPGYNTVIMLLFLVTMVASLYDHSDDETPAKQKYAARWLSSFGVMLSAAGFGRLIMDSGLAAALHGPTVAWSVIAPIAQNLSVSLGDLARILLVLAIPSAVLAFCASFLMDDRNTHLSFSIASFVLLVGGGLIFYAMRGTGGAELRSIATWILLLFGVVIWTMAAVRRKILVLVASLGVLFSGSFLCVAVRLLRAPFDAAVAALRLELQPLQNRALGLLTQIIPNEFLGLILLLVACLLVSMLLGLPVSASKRIPKLFRFPLDRTKMVYFAAVVLMFMESDHEIFRGIAFILLLLSLVGMFAMLGVAFAVRKTRAVIAVLYTILCMALMTIPFALFAVQFAWIIFGVIIALNLIGMAKAAKGAFSEKDQQQAAHANASAAIHDAVMAGGNVYALSDLQTIVNSTFGIERSIWD